MLRLGGVEEYDVTGRGEASSGKLGYRQGYREAISIHMIFPCALEGLASDSH